MPSHELQPKKDWVHISVNLPSQHVEQLDNIVEEKQKQNAKYNRSDEIREIVSSHVEGTI